MASSAPQASSTGTAPTAGPDVPPAQGRVLRPRTKIISHKNTCGAPAPATSLKKRTAATKRPKKPAKNPNNNISSSPATADFNFLNVVTQGARLEPGTWCSGCRNGGVLELCTKCKKNAFCNACIDFNVVDGVQFVCPKCFLMTKKVPGPYPFIFMNEGATRENWPTILTDPLAIVSIRLSGMDSTDSPAAIVYQHLLPWLRGNLVHVELDFDFRDDESQQNFEDRLEEMMELFISGTLKRWKRFFVFLTTHSDPPTGNLHIGPNNWGAVPIAEILNVIFPSKFREILKQSDSNLLGMLSCGTHLGMSESKAALREFSNMALFHSILAFTQTNFQPSLTFKLFQDIGISHFVYERQSLKYSLRENPGLGAHTGVIQFQPGWVDTFLWTHRGSHPMGTPLILQCPDCKKLKTRKPQRHLNTDTLSVLKCTKCGRLDHFCRPNGSKWAFDNETQDDDRGAWFVIRETAKSILPENQMDVDK